MKALVTGANKGIGFEIARSLAKKGYEIYVGARDEVRGEAATEKLREEGFVADFVKIDLNDLVASDFAKISSLDILVNNAGISGKMATGRSAYDMGKSAFDYTAEELQETLSVNFLGTHGVILALLDKLTDEAKILNVTIPISGNPYWQPLAYITSKAALNSMTMAFGYQFIKDGSKKQIFGVMPGAVATDLNGMSKIAPEEIPAQVKTPEKAGALITSFLFDGKNHNAQIINFDGTEITSYEPEMGFAAKDMDDRQKMLREISEK
ncbi:SDR family NAD(P)-dependent oxidoreductase [Lactococcus nasutitermitis]|uniref:SDR family NAD(P)-dependent oxidoreductase n=1 Tax=Lactococcus nasutitermitis TaxID=1652957 RepID=A0ABV9JDP7_9LACT|nr:SDR family NAD(P)-dependent oxidoreductase [Lactococcus nasutitermitis]